MSVRKRQREEKERHIIEAAAQVFARKGFTGAVIAEVAELAGIGKGTIYEYFDSKEDLFFAVFEWFSQKIGTAGTVRISALGGSASSRLMVLSESIIGSWVEMRDMFSLVFEFWAASASSDIRERFKEAFRDAYGDFRSIVSSLIRDGIDRGEFRRDVDPEAIAASLVGTWDALFLQAWFDEAFDLSSTNERYMNVLIRGLSEGKGDDPKR
jgi:AcrR family transcriptional regulator